MVVVPKANGDVRICVDMTNLNEALCRERHILPSVEQSLAQLDALQVVTKLDARLGFWQISLSSESRALTTFITPFGRYCFNVLPFGIASGPEHFQRRMSQLLDGLSGVIVHADDVLVCGRDRAEHDVRLTAVLTRLQETGLTLNEKCTFAHSEVLFLGHKIIAAGIEPDPEKISAITDMTIPQNVAEVGTFLGMATYVGKFLPQFSDTTKPLSDLLAKENDWSWGHMQQVAFDKIKGDLTSKRVLAQYRPHAKTKVSADASSFGLGAVLTQMQDNREWRPIAYISRSLSDTEQRYAQVEKEALAITWLSQYLILSRSTLTTTVQGTLKYPFFPSPRPGTLPKDMVILVAEPESYTQHLCDQRIWTIKDSSIKI
uniref:ribonuclease H n=1 Tax=Oncorhynchus mykiss TaxID=8022 RepID=A0A8K9WN46_ONCMY